MSVNDQVMLINVRIVLSFSVHIELAEVGARCLVYIGNICPTVWMEYCAGDVGSAGVLVSVVKNAAAR